MNRVPQGWSEDQLQALNDLVDAQEAFQVVDQVIADARDASPQASRLWSDLLAHQGAAWARLKALTPTS